MRVQPKTLQTESLALGEQLLVLGRVAIGEHGGFVAQLRQTIEHVRLGRKRERIQTWKDRLIERDGFDHALLKISRHAGQVGLSDESSR